MLQTEKYTTRPILSTKRFKSRLKKASTRTFLGANLGNDTDLTLTSITLKLKSHCNTKNHRI
ncbi:hypothetical protein DPMN_137816 [Dreissena polymorpha]|uniref:Uncharacterized protein n=1 Tax=Dreissena polymorpha TaxID=45954 RepID=A0A9D4G8L2_DREPO|nr:hypothetical protein DPMN_137816 [Dreissena polymorpha]